MRNRCSILALAPLILTRGASLVAAQAPADPSWRPIPLNRVDCEKLQVPAKRLWTEPKLDIKRPPVGYIGLQNHDPGDVVRFKEVSVRALDERP